MSFYIDQPLKWPGGAVFGNICVLNQRHNQRATLFREALQEFARVIDADLDLFKEIAQMIMNGQSTKDITRSLSHGRSTVEFHRNNIRSKLDLRHGGKNLCSLLLSLQ